MSYRLLSKIVACLVLWVASAASAQLEGSQLVSFGALYLDPSGPNTRELTLGTFSVGRQISSNFSIGGELMCGGPHTYYDPTIVTTEVCETHHESNILNDLLHAIFGGESGESTTTTCHSETGPRGDTVGSLSAFGCNLWTRMDVVQSKQVRLFADASVGVLTFDHRYPNLSGTFTEAIFQAGIGMAFQLSETMSIQGGVRQMFAVGDNEFSGDGTTYWMGVGFRF